MPRKRIRKAAATAQMDGVKMGMGGYESKMRMDDMPIDWIEQVLTFLPLTDVYKCKSVCKAWHVAADRVLSDWETLVMKDKKTQLVTGKKQIKTRPVRADKNQIFVTDDATWLKRLKQLVRLKEIFVTGRYCSKLQTVVNDVVIRNANTLTFLHMDTKRLPFDPKQLVVFDNLRDLKCRRIDIDQAVQACPRLVTLRTSASTPVKVLQKLPADTLTSLRIDDLVFRTISHEAIEQLVAALSRLTRLKSLSRL